MMMNNTIRKDVTAVMIQFRDGTSKFVALDEGWLRVATARIMKNKTVVAEEYQSLSVGGRIAERYDDALHESQIPESIPENDEEVNGIDN